MDWHVRLLPDDRIWSRRALYLARSTDGVSTSDKASWTVDRSRLVLISKYSQEISLAFRKPQIFEEHGGQVGCRTVVIADVFRIIVAVSVGHGNGFANQVMARKSKLAGLDATDR